MKYNTLGRTGLECSAVGLGTWAFASEIYGKVQEKTAKRTIRAALEQGINFFDTAPLYGNDERDGISEEILGRALGNDRDQVLISTKFGRYSTEHAAAHFHAKRARESVEGSLRRLGTDHVDVLFFHSPFSPDEIYDDVWGELDKLKEEGKVRCIGHSISLFQDTQQMARNWAAQRKIDLVQVVYSLMNRESTALIHDLGRDGVGIVARESLANGFLSGTITRDTVFEKGHLNARYPHEEIEARVAYIEKLQFLVRGEVKTLPQAAFRWVLDNPYVSLVLSGASTPEQLVDGVVAAHLFGYLPEELGRAEAIHVRDFQAA
jgi:aryl-alcohol dehydrogenase-like predicted oxidoreductase